MRQLWRNSLFAILLLACLCQMALAAEAGEEMSAAVAEGSVQAEPVELPAPADGALDITITAEAAAGPIADADFNNGAMHWTISTDGVLTISGAGVMPDYSESSNAPWYPYRSQIGSIVVEEGITGLGGYAFHGLSSAMSVSLPDSLTALGWSCFRECSSLAAVDLPTGITELPGYAFYMCSSLKSIVIPEGVTDLSASYMFYGCSSLTSITLPGTLQRIGENYSGSFSDTNITNIYYNGTLSQWLSISFNGNSWSDLPMCSPCNLYLNGEKLTNLTIPADVARVPDYAFKFVNLNSVTLSHRVKEIGANAFYGSSVASVRMMDSVTAVGTNAFANCSALKKVYFVGDQTKWSSIAWNTGNDALIDAERVFVSSLESDVRTVSVGPVEHGTVTVSDAYCVAGDVITVSAQPDLGWRLRCVKVNGVEIAGNSFTAEANTDYVVTAEFEFYMDVKDHGTCGPNLTWYLFDNNELVINGTGAMNFNNGNAPWYNYRGVIQSIAIDEGVTSIGYNAFQYCTQVESVVLPDSVERIEYAAFSGCSALIRVELPRSLTYVNGPFYNCHLEEVYYPGDIADWLKIEFTGNYGGHPQAITKKLYIGGELVENLAIPEGVTRIPACAFSGYRGLRSISFSGSLQTIGDRAFNGCDLASAEFLGSAPNIGVDVFAPTNGSNMTNFVIYYHTGTTGWSSPTWNGYYAACVEAFSDYSALDADNRNAQGILFTLNDAAKTAMVGTGSPNAWNNAGYYGAQKGAVVIPDTVTKNGTAYRVIAIGPNAFSRNQHVTSVSIGMEVTSIIPSAFMACPKLESITVSAGNQYYSSIDGVLYDLGGLYLYVYPGGKPDASFAVPGTVNTIGTLAFYDNEHLRSLTVGRSVTAIYRQSFCGLTNLEEITLPFIGTRERTADESYSYYSEQFPSVFNNGYYGRNSLGPYFFDGGDQCYADGSLRRVTITGGTLYQRSFVGCGSIQEISVATVPTAIPNQCFSKCLELQKVIFFDQLCSIGEMNLPEGIETIGVEAFRNCKAITSVTLPASLTSIDSTAFSGAGLERFTVASGNRNYSTDSWGVLYNIDKTVLVQYPACRKWPYYNVASSTVSIGNQAFSGCEKLANLYIPNSVTSFGSPNAYNNQAIVNCPYLTLCCYKNSAAYNYALNNSLTAWYMDNKALQSIRIYSEPDQKVQVQGQVDLEGLYVVGNYGGKELQIDDYTLSYDQRTSGVKTVTVEYQGRTVTFEMVLYVSSAGNIIAFRCDEDLDGKTVMIAVYNSSGTMLHTEKAIIANGEVQIGVNSSVYQNADYAKLFVLEEKTFVPTADAREQPVC